MPIYISGKVHDYDQNSVTIVAPYSDWFLLDKRKVRDVEIRIDDGRSISNQQRRKIYATLRDIADYTGHTTEEMKDHFKAEYVAQTGNDWFSLSDVDMTTANEYLQMLIEFCVYWGIPSPDNIIERSPDIARTIYFCAMHKKCCISGDKAELHHVDAIGMGRNRKEIIHEGMMVLPLSRKYHTLIHTIGRDTFLNKYHVFGIRMDEYLCRVWKVKAA